MAACLLLAQAVWLARSACVNSPVYDEWAHLPSGISHWTTGNFDLYRVNPPLVRMLAALPVALTGHGMSWSSFSKGTYDRPEFDVAGDFQRMHGRKVFWLFTIARWALIPVSMLGGWVVYRWARELFGHAAGLLALTLWCFCPNILAWGSTITPDLGAAAFGVAAGYAFWRWLKVPTWTKAGVAGAALGLAELTKSTWIILFGLWPLLWIASTLGTRATVSSSQQDVPQLNPRLLGNMRLCFGLKSFGHGMEQLLLILGLGLYVLNLGYAFEGSFQRLGQFEFISRTLGGPTAHEVPGNRFRESWLGQIPVPLPANYVRGIDVQKYDFEKGKWSYLCGEHKQGGWYHYYLYALAVKTPLGTLFLFFMANVLTACNSKYRARLRDELAFILPALAVLALVSSQTGFSRYLRYMVPALPFFFIFTCRVGRAFEFGPRWLQAACLSATVAAVASGVWIYPHSMSYFNEAAGGPQRGHEHLLDSNIDWGQDLRELTRYVYGHPDASPIYLAYYGLGAPEVAGLEAEPVFADGGKFTKGGEDASQPRYYAISVNNLYGYGNVRDYAFFQEFVPVATAGYSIYIYHVSPDQLMRARQRAGVLRAASSGRSRGLLHLDL